jgi:hypothetical protein
MPLDVTAPIADRKNCYAKAGSEAPARINSEIRAEPRSGVASSASAASSIHRDVGAYAKAAGKTCAEGAVGADAREVKETAASAAFNVMCEQLLASGHTARFVARGQSMQPTILDGDTLVVEPLSGVEPRRGQILLVRAEGKLRAHRVTCLHPRLTTRGDSALEIDPPAEQVLGKVTALQRAGETISLQGRATIFIQRLRITAHRVRRALRLRLASLTG